MFRRCVLSYLSIHVLAEGILADTHNILQIPFDYIIYFLCRGVRNICAVLHTKGLFLKEKSYIIFQWKTCARMVKQYLM